MNGHLPNCRLDLCFTQSQMSAFQEISRDRNPLHTDPEYSRRTQFGRLVVYGVSGVLAGLGAWARGRQFELGSVRAKFDKPLFVGEPYTIQISEAGEKAEIRILKGNQMHTRVRFTWRERNSDQLLPIHSTGIFQPLSAAKEWDGKLEGLGKIKDSFPYEPDWHAVADFEKNFSLGASQIPHGQLCALLGSSYFVGMEIPGQQALFAELNFMFEPEITTERNFEFRALKVAYDDRFNLVTTSGTGTGIHSFQISAFRRPKPVLYNMKEIRDRVQESLDLKRKTVFISGGCRGFGGVLARAFALQGANLALNYRSSRLEAGQVQNELDQSRGEVMLVQGDVAVGMDCERMRDQVFSQFGKLDFLICNAVPQFETNHFLAQTPAEFLANVQCPVAMCSQLLYWFLPQLNTGATVVQVSTIATIEPVEQLGHYVAAKSAVEGLMRVLACEFKSIRFVIARPPRMLTDTTNLPYDLNNPVSAVDVAAKLVESLRGLDHGRNLFEINL